jgi:hypothetical protein
MSKNNDLIESYIEKKNPFLSESSEIIISFNYSLF